MNSLPFHEIPAAAEHLFKAAKGLEQAEFVQLATTYMQAAAHHAAMLAGGPMTVGDPLPPGMKQQLYAQLCIVFCRRLQKPGHKVVVPIDELDNTGGWTMNLELDQAHRRFLFKVERKN